MGVSRLAVLSDRLSSVVFLLVGCCACACAVGAAAFCPPVVGPCRHVRTTAAPFLDGIGGCLARDGCSSPRRIPEDGSARFAAPASAPASEVADDPATGGRSRRRPPPPPHQRGTQRRRQTRKAHTMSPEDAWLAHLDDTLHQIPLGSLASHVLKKLPPAAGKWSRRRTLRGAERADAFLRRTIAEVEAGNDKARVTTKLCNAALGGWARLGRAEECTKWLIWMNDKSSKSQGEVEGNEGQYDVRPNTISYSTAIQAWSKSDVDGAPAKAEKILRLMESESTGPDVAPNTIVYNEVVHAWARSSVMDKAVRAEKIVARMEALAAAAAGGGSDASDVIDVDVKPDVITYQSLMSAWSTSKVWGAPQRCEEVLTKIDALHKAGNTSHVGPPNAACYAAAIHAWSVSRERSKARSAYRILQHMTANWHQSGNDEVKPDVVTYTAAIGACSSPPEDASAEERREAYDVATLLMEELRMLAAEFGSPNDRTYATYLECIARTPPPNDADGDDSGAEDHKPSERDVAAAGTFARCRKEGQVGEAVLNKMRRYFPHLLCDALGNEEECEIAATGALPTDWTRSVKKDGRDALSRPPRRRQRLERQASGGKRRPKLAKESLSELHALMDKRGTRGQFSREMDADADLVAREEEKDDWRSYCFWNELNT